MTTAKARYELQIGAFVDDIRFDEAQLTMLRSIKDDESFVNAIRHIATLYICLCRDETEALSSGEIKTTLEDLRSESATLSEKLEKLPDAVDILLWKLNYKRGATRKLDLIKTLLSDLVDEIEEALDSLPGGKPGRNAATANRYAADSLIKCFKSFNLPTVVSQWEASAPSSITSCLELIFLCGGRNLSRSAVEEYLKPVKGKITRKKG